MKVGVYAYNLYLVLGPSNIDVLAEIVTFWMKETKNANLIKTLARPRVILAVDPPWGQGSWPRICTNGPLLFNPNPSKNVEQQKWRETCGSRGVDVDRSKTTTFAATATPFSTTTAAATSNASATAAATAMEVHQWRKAWEQLLSHPSKKSDRGIAWKR